MTQTTITVQEATLDRFRELKEELNDAQPETPDHTNDLFLQALMDTWDAADDGHYAECNVEAIAEQVKDAFKTDMEDFHTMGEIPQDAYERANEQRKESGETWIEFLGSEEGEDVEESIDDLTREVRKAQELAEQARDAAQRVEAEIPEQ